MSEMTPKFCTGCGAALADGSRFCTGCGAAVVAESAAESAPVVSSPVAGGESPVAVIPNVSLKSGFMGMKRKMFTLVLTDKRIIFAETTSAMLKQSVADARDQAKSDGKGFFGQWGAQLSAYSALAEGYLAMDPNAALSENPDNFALEESAIDKIKLKAGRVGDEDTGSSPDRLLIKTTAGEKYDLDINSGMGQAKQALIAAELI